MYAYTYVYICIIYICICVYISDTSSIDHLVMREFVSGPPRYRLAIRGIREHMFSKTGFARDSGHERTFSKLQKEIQVPWKLPKQKDFYYLINGSFNQNRVSLRSNVSGGFGHKWRRHLMTRWRWRRK